MNGRDVSQRLFFVLFVCCCFCFWFWFLFGFLTGHFMFCFLLVVSLQSARHRCRSCCRCLRSHTLFVNSFLSVIQKPETSKCCQFLAKPWRPQDVDEEVDAAAVDQTQFQVDKVACQKDVGVATIDEEIVHDGCCDAQDDDGWWGQDEDGGHDHQHPGQGHLT